MFRPPLRPFFPQTLFLESYIGTGVKDRCSYRCHEFTHWISNIQSAMKVHLVIFCHTLFYFGSRIKDNFSFIIWICLFLFFRFYDESWMQDSNSLNEVRSFS